MPGCPGLQVLRAPAGFAASPPSCGLSAGVQVVTLDQAAVAVKTATLSERALGSSSRASPPLLGAAQVLAFVPCLTTPS